MGKSIEDIAKDLADAEERVQIIYAFNGTGKTRLSNEFNRQINSLTDNADHNKRIECLYYSASTEDLFYWDREADLPTIRIQGNGFTDWLIQFLRDQGEDRNIARHFQRYVNAKINPVFSSDMRSVSFSLYQRGDAIHNIKISKGEESNFVWSVFYTLLDEALSILSEEESNRSTDVFDALSYVYIDDPVSSLDENHLIELAVDLVKLIKKNERIKFIVSTHNPLFFNVICNTFKKSDSQSKKGNPPRKQR